MSDYQLEERRNFAKANYIPVREIISRILFLSKYAFSITGKNFTKNFHHQS